jgi:hypothetical protein
MSFLYQQVHSLLNLGTCKEYPTMAKVKSPAAKKTEKKDAALSTPVFTAPMEAASALDKPVAEKLVAEKTGSVIPFEVRKQEITKASQRAQIVPNTVQDEIRMRAYELYVQRGYSSGNPNEDWLNAEREVLQRYNHQSA